MIKPSAPILALLGDIGNPALPSYRDFIYQQAERFKLVLVLAGNHEYYSPSNAPPHPTIGTSTREWLSRLGLIASTAELNAAIQLICSEAPHKNVLFMDGKVLELPGVSIMGCILWSDIPEHKRQNVARQMNDYRLIFKSNTCVPTWFWQFYMQPTDIPTGTISLNPMCSLRTIAQRGIREKLRGLRSRSGSPCRREIRQSY